MSTNEDKNDSPPAPSLEVAKGSDDDNQLEQAPSTSDNKKTQDQPATSSSRRVWKQIAIVVVLLLIVFAVAFPLAYVNRDSDDDDDDRNPGGVVVDPGDESKDTDPTNGPGENNNTTATLAPTTPEEEVPPETDEFVVSSKDAPFPVRLAVLDPNVASGYDDKEKLREDLKNAARFLLNNVVYRNIGKPGYGGVGIGQRNPNAPIALGRPFFDGGMMPDGDFMDIPVMAPAPPESAPGPAPEGAASSSGAGVADDFDDFGTNNQEEGVEEGDRLVSDGDNVFAAYGDTVVVWNATSGKIQLELQMPSDIIHSSPNAPKDSGSNGGEEEDTASTRSFIPLPPCYYNDPKPEVRHLLLHDDRLLVIVDASSNHCAYGAGDFRKLPIFYNYLSTHVRLYKIGKPSAQDNNSGVALELVSTADLHGSFHAIRSVNGKAHVVTNSGIDTYSDLIEPFEFYNFKDLTKDEYVKEAQRIAEEIAIPKFVDSIMEELQDGPAFPDLFRISLMQSKTSGEDHLEDFAFGQGVINSLTQVHSFDMTSDKSNMDFTVSGAFLPTYVSHVYGAENALVIVGEGWEHRPRLASGERQPSTQMSHLLGIAIDEEKAGSYPHSIGKVEGYVLNSHSVDVKEDILRIATTVRNSWWWFGPPVLVVDEEPVLVEEPVVDISVLDQSDNGEEDVEGGEPFLITVPPPWPQSSTQNYVTTLNMTSSAGTMEQLGRIQLGKPNEVFTAVRFFDNIAYAVTFERTDPLYALNLTDPNNPWAISELNVTGFSSYLHSINEDNTLILAIGEEADNNGRVLGLMITIFDMRDPTKPKVAQRHVIEKDPTTHSSSASLWDFLATRYAAGRLIIPMNINSWEDKDLNFDGFAVFIANEDEITESCRISQDSPHGHDGGMLHCYHCGNSLPKRSMVFRGDLMTTDRHHVAMTDLDTCQEAWSFDIVSSDRNMCCW